MSSQSTAQTENIALVDSSKINNAPTVTSAQPNQNMINLDVLKAVVFMFLTLLGVIGGITACMTSHTISSYAPERPQYPVDGDWSDWNDWTQCSINCSSASKPFGTMNRTRFCNSPPPQKGGKSCVGIATEVTECFMKPCPDPVDGNWAEWSDWSSCSASCQLAGSIPRQFRWSTCTNPAPKNGGRPCDGESTQERFCQWLPQCPVDGQWGDWYVAGACESVNRKSCALGKKLYQRQCNSPLPSGSGLDCKGLKEKNEDCWFDIGCPVGLQPPLSVQVFGNGSGVFEVRWQSVPYGVVATKYRIHLSVEGANHSQMETVRQDVPASPSRQVTGTKYSQSVDLTRFLNSPDFVTVAVRMSSMDYWGSESSLSVPVLSHARGVDGQWGDWDHWSDCTTQCINKRGTRSRKRKCDNPAPVDGGKYCLGKSEEEASCIGMETDC